MMNSISPPRSISAPLRSHIDYNRIKTNNNNNTTNNNNNNNNIDSRMSRNKYTTNEIMKKSTPVSIDIKISYDDNPILSRYELL